MRIALASHPARSCNPSAPRLQPHAPEAATPCTRGCNLAPRRYANLEELWTDLNLMFDNAKLFNGPDSWVTKHEVRPRPLLEKKADP